MQTEKNNSPEDQNKTGTESSENKIEASAGGELLSGAGETNATPVEPELKEEHPPVFKLHVSFEFVTYIKAVNRREAKAKLVDLKIGDKLNDSNVTFLETIPYEQYKDFKVEIID